MIRATTLWLLQTTVLQDFLGCCRISTHDVAERTHVVARIYKGTLQMLQDFHIGKYLGQKFLVHFFYQSAPDVVEIP